MEPMQIDVDPQEDQQNSPDINYVVENPTLVRAAEGCGYISCPWSLPLRILKKTLLKNLKAG